MTDKERILKFAKEMGFAVKVYDEPKYICEDAKKLGAVESINFLYGELGIGDAPKAHVDLNFEISARGKCVAYSTSHQGSFYERPNRRKQ